MLDNQLAVELKAPVMFGVWALDLGDVPRSWVVLRRTLPLSAGRELRWRSKKHLVACPLEGLVRGLSGAKT